MEKAIYNLTVNFVINDRHAYA